MLDSVTTADDLEAHIRGRLRGQVCELRLHVGDEGVILRGRAPSYYVKQLAQQYVMESRMPILANEIEVSEI